MPIISFLSGVFTTSFAKYLERKSGIDHHAQDPAEGNGEANILWSFYFEILPAVYRAHNYVLGDAQKAGDANGSAPAHLMNVQNKFDPKSLKKYSTPNL